MEEKFIQEPIWLKTGRYIEASKKKKCQKKKEIRVISRRP